jgi:hypothetical protein
MRQRKRPLALMISASCCLALALLVLTWRLAPDGWIGRTAATCSSTYWRGVQSGTDSDLQDGLNTDPSQNNRASSTIYGQYDRRTNTFCGSYFLAGTITITHTLPPGDPLNNWFDLQLTVDRKEVTASANEPGPGTYTLQTRALSGTCVTLAMGFLYLLIANAGTLCVACSTPCRQMRFVSVRRKTNPVPTREQSRRHPHW